MKIEAIFESWHVPDGNYPPLSVGNYVNLSFELEHDALEAVAQDVPQHFTLKGNAKYEFCGSVLRKYNESEETPVLIIEAAEMRFYINSAEVMGYRVGTQIKGHGTLLLDHYIWVEFLDSYKNPPNLFYNLQVKRIRKVRIPESFIQRNFKGKLLPTRVDVNKLSAEYLEELQTMLGQSFDEEFYLIEFDNEGLGHKKIQKTFL